MKIPGMGNMMKQLQEMQEKMKEAEQKVQELEITGEAGGGLVKATFKGNGDCKFDISAEALEDKEMLEDLCAAAAIDARRKFKEEKEKIMGGVAGGMKMPAGLDGLLGG